MSVVLEIKAIFFAMSGLISLLLGLFLLHHSLNG